MESFDLLVPNADLSWDVSSAKAFWLGGNKNKIRALLKGCTKKWWGGGGRLNFKISLMGSIFAVKNER